MKLLGNIIWVLFGGLFAAIGWVLTGLLLCVTIVFIPFGLQFFKFAKLVLWPFGKEIVTNFDKHPILNIIWIIFFGFATAVGYLMVGFLFFITIIGIPFAKQWLKLARLTLIPFGAEIK